MLLLAAIAHLMPFRAQSPIKARTSVNPALGHVGLTIIALVYVLIVMWQS